MAKKRIMDPAVINAENTPDSVFEKGGCWNSFDRVSSVKNFGRNKVLSGRHSKKK